MCVCVVLFFGKMQIFSQTLSVHISSALASQICHVLNKLILETKYKTVAFETWARRARTVKVLAIFTTLFAVN